jgi:outer membrane protein assembly factor BamB
MTLSSIALWIVGALTFSAELLQGAPSSLATVKYFRADGGVAEEAPGPLPAHLDLPENLVWRKPLDSGHSTPLLYSGKLFLTTFQEEKRELATLALDAATGEILWKQVAPAERVEPYHKTGSPAAPTPACDGERLHVFCGSYGMLCYDLDGQQLWTRPMGPFQDEFGSGSSPVLADGKLILNQDHDIDSFLMALDPKTGNTLWKIPRPNAVRSYSTPAIWTRANQTQILVAGALELTSYDAASGRKLWWVNGLARIVIPTPVVDSDMIYIASWSPGGDSGARISFERWPEALARWDKNKDDKISQAELEDPQVLERFFRMDLDQNKLLDRAEWEKQAQIFQRAQNAVLAIRPRGEGDLTESGVVWKYPRGTPYVPTPLVHNGIFWMVKDGGIVTKLNAATGELLHQERLAGSGGYYASPVTADGKVYFASQQGVVSVVANQRDWKLIASHDFGESIYATPVLERNRIYVRTVRALYCFQGGQKDG